MHRGTMQGEHAMNARYCKYAGGWRRGWLQGVKWAVDGSRGRSLAGSGVLFWLAYSTVLGDYNLIESIVIE